MYPLDQTVGHLLLAVVSQETAIRGFLLTQNQTFLEPFEQGKREAEIVNQQLTDIGIRDHHYKAAIESIQESLAQVELFFLQVKQLIDDDQVEEAFILHNEGNSEMELFREQIQSLSKLVVSTIAKSWSDQKSRANYSMNMIIAGSIISFFAIIATWMMFRTTKQALKNTFDSERRYRRLVDHSPDAIAVHQDGIVVFANPACAQLMGVDDSAQLIGMPMLKFVHQPFADLVVSRAKQAIEDNEVGALDEQFIKLDGEIIDVEVTAIGFPYNGRPAVLIMAREVGFRKEAERKMEMANTLLQRLSMLDGLTGISNRRSFDEDIQKYWNASKHNQVPITILLFDIDNFKAYNDFYGHQAGDVCLQSIADTAEDEAKKVGGTAYRYGGEEFAILLPDLNEDKALHVASRIRQAIEERFIPNAGISSDTLVTISIGVATSDLAYDQSWEQWLRAADQALYKAKNQGRNSISVAEKVLN
nr:diguanylate cyclase [Cohnella sp. WQ 127256]